MGHRGRHTPAVRRRRRPHPVLPRVAFINLIQRDRSRLEGVRQSRAARGRGAPGGGQARAGHRQVRGGLHSRAHRVQDVPARGPANREVLQSDEPKTRRRIRQKGQRRERRGVVVGPRYAVAGVVHHRVPVRAERVVHGEG